MKINSQRFKADEVLLKRINRYNVFYRIIIYNVFNKLMNLRKSKNISNNIINSEMLYWEKFETKRVIASLCIYIRKEYYKQNKNEKYIRGIIRMIDDKQIENIQLFDDKQLDKIQNKIRTSTISECKRCLGKGYVYVNKDSKAAFKECDCVRIFKQKRTELTLANNLSI